MSTIGLWWAKAAETKAGQLQFSSAFRFGAAAAAATAAGWKAGWEHTDERACGIVLVWVNLNEDDGQLYSKLQSVKRSNGGVEWFSTFYEGDIEGGPPHSVGPLLGEFSYLLPAARRHAI